MKRLKNSIVLAPILYLFLSVFVLRSYVGWFYVLSILLVASLALLAKSSKLPALKNFALVLLVAGSIGLSAATILTLEKIEIIKNPDHITSCSISPVVACSPIIDSDQATAFAGIPNPIFGLFGFSILLAAGMTILAGPDNMKLKKSWWYTLLASVSAAVIFCLWLINAALYDIGSLCLYCMAVWAVCFSLFWILLAFMLEQDILKISPSIDKFLIKNRNLLITLSFGIVALMIYFRWADYWNSLF